MAIHLNDCFAPGVGLEAPVRLEAALARAGRRVEARRPLALDADLPVQARGALRWRVLRMPGPGGTALFVEEQPGAPAWDLELCRALSSVCEGFVVAREAYRAQSREALATFFAGRTVELASWTQLEGHRHVGAPRITELLGGRDVSDVYEDRFSLLCRVVDSDASLDETIAGEDWSVSPPVGAAFTMEAEGPTTRVLLADVEPEAWKERGLALVPPGWRWRSLRAPKLDSAYVELAREDGLDAELVTRLSGALSCATLGVEVPGRGGPCRHAEAWRGTPESHDAAQGAQALFRVLGRFATLLGEGAGMIFGRGNDGWNESPG